MQANLEGTEMSVQQGHSEENINCGHLLSTYYVLALYNFIRFYQPQKADIIVPFEQIKKLKLKEGKSVVQVEKWRPKSFRSKALSHFPVEH